jgi:hypothetical protein
MDTFVHVGGLQSHKALSYKLKAPNLGFRLMHKPPSLLMVHLLPHGYVLVNKLQ